VALMGLSGKTAVVTGAASGMGRATAIGLGSERANVALFDIDDAGANRVAKEIDAAGVQTMVCKVDVAKPADIRSALAAVHHRFGRLDVVANVAGIYPQAKVPEVTEDFWDHLLSVNLRGVFFLCQEALRIMVPQGGGAIVNVASDAAFRAFEGHAAYTAAKAGLVGMTRVIALEYARKGVRVNVVAPGYTPSERWYDTANLDPAVADTLVPGRFMTPEEQANAIIWLCSNLASGVNGATINVNGGHYMR
jgi:NAD(P)-dependent dehydrogenase (short-subunit alcohol dehydrogenase family)